MGAIRLMHKIEISIDEAASILGIELPTEFRLVKAAYRRLAMFCHPDVGGDPDKFIEVEKAYRMLEESPEILTSLDGAITETVDGTPLSEIGKGYSLNVSAKTCGECEGRGYQLLKEPRWIKCDDCHGTGWKHVPCKRCGGSGRFSEKTECTWCEGSGEFVPYIWAKKNGKLHKRLFLGAPIIPQNYYCTKCQGRKEIYEPAGKTYAVKCDECKGVGEVKMFNPVLPRGLLRARVK